MGKLSVHCDAAEERRLRRWCSVNGLPMTRGGAMLISRGLDGFAIDHLADGVARMEAALAGGQVQAAATPGELAALAEDLDARKLLAFAIGRIEAVHQALLGHEISAATIQAAEGSTISLAEAVSHIYIVAEQILQKNIPDRDQRQATCTKALEGVRKVFAISTKE